MNFRIVRWFVPIAFTCALLIATQTSSAQQQTAKHHHYKFIELGTFGGPASGVNGEPSVQVINNAGTVVGGADTSMLTPVAGGFNPVGRTDSFHFSRVRLEWQEPEGLGHASRWRLQLCCRDQSARTNYWNLGEQPDRSSLGESAVPRGPMGERQNTRSGNFGWHSELRGHAERPWPSHWGGSQRRPRSSFDSGSGRWDDSDADPCRTARCMIWERWGDRIAGQCISTT